MIQKIEVNNYGSFIGFSNDTDKFPNQNVIIHGLNGTGKSQLCSILGQIASLRKSKQLSQQSKAEEEKKIAKKIASRLSKEAATSFIDIGIDGYNLQIDVLTNRIIERGNLPDIYVFNDEYVYENIGDLLNIHNQEIRIGQKNVQRDSAITEKQEKEKAIKKVLEEIDKIVQEAKVESTYEGQSRTDKIINRENYLASINPEKADSDAKAQLDRLSSPPDPIISHQRYSFPNTQIDEKSKTDMSVIIGKAYIEPKLTQEIYKAHLVLNKKYYEDGIRLFTEIKTVCPFCLSPKNSDDPCIQELIQYLQSDYNNSINIINGHIGFLEQKKEELLGFCKNWNTIVPQISEKIKTLGLDNEVKELVLDEGPINNIITLLKWKKENMDLVKNIVEEKYLNLFEHCVAELKKNIFSTS
jgi:hypothetical protein